MNVSRQTISKWETDLSVQDIERIISGTAESILEAVKRINACYDTYSRNAYKNSKDYDYRRVNQKVYGLLCSYWTPEGGL